MIDYIIIEPSDSSHDKGYKFPYFSSEILCCDNPKIQEMFLKNENNQTQAKDDSNSIFEGGSFGSLEDFSKNLENKNGSDEKKLKNEKNEESVNVEIKIIEVDNKIEEKKDKNDLNEKKEEILSELFFKNDLLDYFLSFLDSKSELNYVLCGYFAKFFNAIFAKNSTFVKI